MRRLLPVVHYCVSADVNGYCTLLASWSLPLHKCVNEVLAVGLWCKMLCAATRQKKRYVTAIHSRVYYS